MAPRIAILLTVLAVSLAAKVGRAAQGPGGDRSVSFRIVPRQETHDKKHTQFLVELLNKTAVPVRVAVYGLPLVTGYTYYETGNRERQRENAGNKVIKLPDVNSIAIVQTDTLPVKGPICPPVATVVELKRDKEVLLNAEIDLSAVPNGRYSVSFNLAVLDLDGGRETCVPVRFLRGTPNAEITVDGDIASVKKGARSPMR
jgi:hypothetical protein